MCLIKSSFGAFFHKSEFAKLTFHQFFLSGFANEGVINKDPNVQLDGARPANTCIPPSFLGKPYRSCSVYPPQKYVCKYKKNCQNLVKSHFL
jgi:hypothetical protein